MTTEELNEMLDQESRDADEAMCIMLEKMMMNRAEKAMAKELRKHARTLTFAQQQERTCDMCTVKVAETNLHPYGKARVCGWCDERAKVNPMFKVEMKQSLKFKGGC